MIFKPSSSVVGCFVGLNFVRALAYADNIVLLDNSPSAMHKLLLMCNSFAADHYIKFNPDSRSFLPRNGIIVIVQCMTAFPRLIIRRLVMLNDFLIWVTFLRHPWPMAMLLFKDVTLLYVFLQTN